MHTNKAHTLSTNTTYTV